MKSSIRLATLYHINLPCKAVFPTLWILDQVQNDGAGRAAKRYFLALWILDQVRNDVTMLMQMTVPHPVDTALKPV